jgi:hypothetical protein
MDLVSYLLRVNRRNAAVNHARHIEPDVLHARVVPRDRVYENRERTVGLGVIRAACTGQVSDLYGNVTGKRQQLLQEYPGLLDAVGPRVVDVRVHVHHDRHPMIIRRAKDTLQLLELTRTVGAYIRVAEVHLERALEHWVSGATSNFLERVFLERVDRTSGEETIRVLRDLRRGPVVLGANPRLLVLKLPAGRPCMYATDSTRAF